MNDQLSKWKSKFGDDYVQRNQLTEENINARQQLWTFILNSVCTPLYSPKRFLEVGAGVGGNLKALSEIYQHNGVVPELVAVEPNEIAAKELQKIEYCTRIGVDAFKIDSHDYYFDMSFTSGVLIHIHPDDQLRAMKEIYRTSKKYIVCIEYFAAELREVKYRDEKEMMWLRDYGAYWMDNFPLRCTNYGFLWKKVSGLDNLNWWVLEKAH